VRNAARSSKGHSSETGIWCSAAMPSTAAITKLETARKRRYRARLRAGVIVVDLEVSHEVIGLLLDTHYLDIAASEDCRAIATAIAEMLNDAAKHKRE